MSDGIRMSREQLENELAALREVGWTPDKVKAGSLHIDEVSGAYQFDEANDGEQTYADLAKDAGIPL
ncbi:hypothetical protein GCM10023221_10560 [Luteimicrobium xylanilyticum]|uniref:Uncharacterized protein n=1 Tax=Luteimicrobium xylanilyticum TaxID=1133546 RepID=A0A5P9QDB8_9MICO|nr:hypothetical protein [Luteimicrobium xylanilyticum]QFU99468.1 hypothetical protein KDY119_02999 [Luteimicrobium xylanilyticum]